MIVAVDFDGILCEAEAFPAIGRPNYAVISVVRQLMDAGAEVILWTSRAGDELDDAVKWCEDRGLHFCAVNDNAPSNKSQYSAKYPEGTRKVYADIYVDDHSLFFASMEAKKGYEWTAREVVDTLKEVLSWQKKEEN